MVSNNRKEGPTQTRRIDIGAWWWEMLRKHKGDPLSDMTEEKAREILGDGIKPDNSVCKSSPFIFWAPGYDMATLDGGFSPDELEAIAWWMRNKKE